MASKPGFALHLEASFAIDDDNYVLVVVRCPKSRPALRTGVGLEPAEALEDALQQHVRFASADEEREVCVAALLGRDLRLRLDASRQLSLVA